MIAPVFRLDTFPGLTNLTHSGLVEAQHQIGVLVHVGLVGGYVVLVGLGAALHDPRQEEGGEDGGEDEGQIPAPRRGVEQGACGEQYHPLRPLGQEVVQKHRHRRKYEEG